MRNRRLIGSAALAAIAMGTSACHPVRQALHIDQNQTVMTVATTLSCPDEQGRLTRVSASADGHTCVYRGDQGDDVTLTLISLNGQTPQMALQPLEMQLRAVAPKIHADPAPPEPPTPPAPPNGEDHAKTGAGTSHHASDEDASDEDHDEDHDDDRDGDRDGDRDRAKVDLPFVHVDADDGHGRNHAKVDVPFVHVDADDDKAHVKVFGVTIDADDDNANVHTNWGSKSAMIKAGPQGAEIRAIDLRRGADMLYILASDAPGPSGYRSVGYVARGPSAGPLVVGSFKSKAEHHGDFHDRDVDALIRLNVK